MSAAPAAMLSTIPAVAVAGAGGARMDAASAADGAGFASWLGADVGPEAAVELSTEDAPQAANPIDPPTVADVAGVASPPVPPTPTASPLMGAMLQALSVRADGTALFDAADSPAAMPTSGAGATAPDSKVPPMPWPTDLRGPPVAQAVMAAPPRPADAAAGEPAGRAAPASLQTLFSTGVAATIAAANLPVAAAAPGVAAAPPAAPAPPPAGTISAFPIAASVESRSEAPAAPRAKPASFVALASAAGATPDAGVASPLPDALAPTAADPAIAAQGAGIADVEPAPGSAATIAPLVSPLPTGVAAHGALATPVAQAARADGALPPVQVPLDSPQWGNEFASRVVAMVREDFAEAEIHVTPAELGPIEVKIRIEGDRLHAQFGAVSAEAREALTSNLHRLRELLASDGLSLGQAFVGHHGSGSPGDRGGGGSPPAPSLPTSSSAEPGDERATVRAPRGDRDALLDEFA